MGGSGPEPGPEIEVGGTGGCGIGAPFGMSCNENRFFMLVSEGDNCMKYSKDHSLVKV